MVELLAAHYLAAMRYEEEFAAPDSDRLHDLRHKAYTYARGAGIRAGALSNKEHAARWFRAAVEQARVLDLPARERTALALEYGDAAGGYEPHEAIRQCSRRPWRSGRRRPIGPSTMNSGWPRSAPTWRSTCTSPMRSRPRALLRSGMAALEPGPPTLGRAALRARLGWTYWRAGPLEDAPAILREAIEEARACDAQAVERVALHDLGIATGMLGDSRQALALVEESMDLARAANDRWLLTRCYNNVPTVMHNNGETNERIMPLYVEGLERARRSMDHASASRIAQNLADCLRIGGRLREAARYVEEAITAAQAVGELGMLASCLGQRAFIRLSLGDREGTRADIGESRRAITTIEPQECDQRLPSRSPPRVAGRSPSRMPIARRSAPFDGRRPRVIVGRSADGGTDGSAHRRRV